MMSALAPILHALDLPPREAMREVAAMGFRVVQVSAMRDGLRPRDLGQSARRDLLAALRRNELSLAGVDLWIPPDHFDDPTTADRAVSATTEAIEFAADLGRCTLSMLAPTDGGVRSVISNAAERHGVPIADFSEATSGARTIGVGLDPAAEFARGKDPAARVLEAGSNLSAARLNDLSTDGVRIAPGARRGRLDVTAYRAALSVVGYARPIVIDSRHWADCRAGILQSVSAWKAAGQAS